MTENDELRSGPGAGLSATGRTADDFSPGETSAGGATYGDPGGTGTAGEELADEDARRAAEQPAGVENAEK